MDVVIALLAAAALAAGVLTLTDVVYPWIVKQTEETTND